MPPSIDGVVKVLGAFAPTASGPFRPFAPRIPGGVVLTEAYRSSKHRLNRLSADVRSLAELSLPDSEGGLHRLGELWPERPTVLVFARHFG